MRIAPWLLAAACAASAAIAQSPVVSAFRRTQVAERIEWSAERRLTKGDFRGRVPAGATNASLSWLNIEAEWECREGEFFSSAIATFDPSRSWWRSLSGNVWGASDLRGNASRPQLDGRRSVMQQDLQLLEHEQLHFDIAEVAARKLRKHFAEFDDACEEPDGMAPVQRGLERIDREMQEEQERYDRETSHGLIAKAQQQWKRKIEPLVR